jgi:16S rRNA (guanine527-N7)-methyltransferase
MSMTSREFDERLSRRARKASVPLTLDIVERLEEYYRLLARWNTKVNLTALQLSEFTDQAVDRLLIEPLAAARFVLDSPLAWFDLGSGGGSPAIPLKIARPAARLTMVESKVRKAAFLREAVRMLGLADASVENERFEDVAARQSSIGAADLLTVRAVKTGNALFDATRALLREGGRLVLFGSSGTQTECPPGFQLLEAGRLAGPGSSQIVACVRTGGPGDVSRETMPEESTKRRGKRVR